MAVTKEGKSQAPSPLLKLLMLVVCTGGIFATYMTYAVIQEWVYLHKDSDGGSFTYTLTLLLVQCAFNFVAAAAWVFGAKQHKTPALVYTVPAFSYIFAMLCSNEALKHVSYPTQALAKSCKLIPVMLVNLLVFGKSHTLQQYFMVVLVTVGIIIFQWVQPKHSNDESTTYGLLLLGGSLLLDGVTGPAQKSIVERYSASAAQLMLYCNGWAIVYVVAAMVIFGEGLNGIRYILDPKNTTLVQYLLLFSVCSAVGQIFIFITVNRFG